MNTSIGVSLKGDIPRSGRFFWEKTINKKAVSHFGDLLLFAYSL